MQIKQGRGTRIVSQPQRIHTMVTSLPTANTHCLTGSVFRHLIPHTYVTHAERFARLPTDLKILKLCVQAIFHQDSEEH